MVEENDITVDRAKCMYCGACVSVCPKEAMFLDETEVLIEKDLCIKCGFCIRECPMGAITAGWFQ